jgi:hypothetical protein
VICLFEQLVLQGVEGGTGACGAVDLMIEMLEVLRHVVDLVFDLEFDFVIEAMAWMNIHQSDPVAHQQTWAWRAQWLTIFSI